MKSVVLDVLAENVAAAAPTDAAASDTSMDIEAVGDGRAGTLSAAAATEMAKETPVVATAEPATGWVVLADVRNESTVVEEVAKEDVGVPSCSGGRRWKGGRVGVVLLTVGAGVAVGAAFLGRRR